MGILQDAAQFRSVADQALIFEQLCEIRFGHFGNAKRVEIVESLEPATNASSQNLTTSEACKHETRKAIANNTTFW
eukprot:m.133439 g.133439  ORF g.133439 m.133439 type:complete len:76 (-) comp52411_c0_seq3:289-516(-)